MTVQTLRSLLGVPSSKLTATDSVLIIIDAQGEYATGLLKVDRYEETSTAIRSLLGRYRAVGGSVVHVVHDTPSGAPIFTPDTALAEIVPILTPQTGEPVVHKQHATAFTGTTLQEELDKAGKKKLVVVEKGYDVYAAIDAIGDRDIPGATAEELVRISLAEVADTVATIVESKDIV